MNPMKIYVAHRYNGGTLETLANIGRAVDIGVEIAKKGHYPFIPHLDCQVAIQSKGCLPIDYYYNSSMAFLQACDAIFIVDPNDVDTSKGVKAEFDWAVKAGFTVFYDVNKLPIVGKQNTKEVKG